MASVVAAKVRSRRPSAVRVAVMSGLVAITVIVGLLAMHTLDLHGAGATWQASPGMSTSTAGHHHVPLAAPVPDAPLCAECGTEGHAGMAMACVIALLIVLLVLAPPGLRGAGLRMPRWDAARGRPRARRFFETFSLHALCISRT